MAAPAVAHTAGMTPTFAVTATKSWCAPSTVAAASGTVVFRFTNRTASGLVFRIKHLSTAVVRPGHSATLRVEFSQPGSYSYSCGSTRGGVLKITAPAPPAPVGAKTAVTGTMGEYYFHLSPDSAPVGTVTFTLMNQGRFFHDIYFDLPINKLSQEAPPGQTLTFTVTFTRPGTYSYEAISGEDPENNMGGVFTITG